MPNGSGDLQFRLKQVANRAVGLRGAFFRGFSPFSEPSTATLRSRIRHSAELDLSQKL